jgi:hypothetical protein
VTDDLVLTEPEDVRRYEDLFNRLRRAALSPEESSDLLIEVARSAATTR